MTTYDDPRFHPGNMPSGFSALMETERESLVAWIKKWLRPASKVNHRHTSYGLKHIFQHFEGGFYTTNGQFKGAMEAAGFLPDDPDDLNHHYRITERSTGAAGKASMEYQRRRAQEASR